MERVHNSDSVPGTGRLADRPRIQRVPGDMSPTSNALVRFKVTIKESQIYTTPQPLDPIERTVEVPGKEPEPTSAAEVEFHYREARGRFRVPDR